MEQEQKQLVQVQPAAHLKCPRCASSNTKFCYYNNYSLSQPRYLCKACKRYWTRGGTLRNVPVGGKCRKNKRDKQSSSSSISSSTSMVAAVKPSTTVQSSSLQVDVSSSSTTRTHINNPLFSKRDGKDLSFSQFCMGGDDELGFLTSQNLKPAGEDTNVAAISNQVFSGYPLFGISSSTTTTSTNSTMASIIASCHHQQNMESNGFKESAQTPYGVLGLDGVHQMLMNNDNGELGNDQLVKDAKMEGNENKFDQWKAMNGNQNYNEEMKFSSDLPFMWNSSPAAWLDSSNIGSSVPSLI